MWEWRRGGMAPPAAPLGSRIRVPRLTCMAVVFLTVPLETVTALKVEALEAGLKVARGATTGAATRAAVQATIVNAGVGQARQ